MRIILAIMMIGISGCAVMSALSPQIAPDKSDFYLSTVAPKLVTNVSIGIARYLKWEGLETFESLIICPTGIPEEHETKVCLQAYGGVKIDGSDAEWRQHLGDMRWGYVYKSTEQSAIRIHNISGDTSVYNMGGE